MSTTTRSGPHRVVLVDDHPLLRQGIARVLAQDPDLEVVAEAATLDEAMQVVRKVEPHLVVLDLALGDADALEAIPRLKRLSPGVRVLVLSMFDETIYAERCLLAGASGYVMKEEASTTLLDAVRRVLTGEVAVSDEIQRRMVRRMAGKPLDVGPTEELTDRELQVFRLIGSGRSTRDVAQGLHISPKTVESHRANIMRKLGLEKANQLVHRATLWVQQEVGMP